MSSNVDNSPNPISYSILDATADLNRLGVNDNGALRTIRL